MLNIILSRQIFEKLYCIFEGMLLSVSIPYSTDNNAPQNLFPISSPHSFSNSNPLFVFQLFIFHKRSHIKLDNSPTGVNSCTHGGGQANEASIHTKRTESDM